MDPMDKAKNFNELRQVITCRKNAENNTNTCYHPECDEKTINSHILQRNGMLDKISQNSHLWQIEIDHYKEGIFQFKRRGLKDVLTFNGFCEKHDTEIFKEIEGENIDFDNYRTHILFCLRTLYNELFRKQVNLKYYGCIVNKFPEKYNNEGFHLHCRGTRLGIQDLQEVEKRFWDDLYSNKQSYVFRHKVISKIELVVSAAFNYVTSSESSHYTMATGKDIGRMGEIYINLIPYADSSILMMGYYKQDEKMVKKWFDSFFDCEEQQTYTKITNLIVFQCETWACSDNLYNDKIKGTEGHFYTAVDYALINPNERQMFNLNIVEDDFKEKFKDWEKGIRRIFGAYLPKH